MASGPQEAPNSLIANPSLNILDLLGEGPMGGFVQQSGIYGNDPLTSTYYDNVPVRNLDGSYNFNVSGQGFSLSYTLGTTGQLAMPGFEQVENILTLSSDTQVTNPPTGAGNIKNVTAVFNTSMFPDANAIRVTVRVPALYTVDTNNGNTNGFNVSYSVNISLNNQPYVSMDEITIQGKCTNPYLYSTTYVLPKTTPPQASYQWNVQIRKTDLDVLSTTTQNSLYVDSIGIISASSLNYPNSVLVGTFIQADQFSNIPVRSYLMNGLLINVPVGYTPTQYQSNVSFSRSCDMDMGNRNIRMHPQVGTGLAGIVIGMPVFGAGLPAGTVVKDYVNSTGPVFGFGVSQDPVSAQTNVPLSFQTNGVTPITPAVYPSIWYGAFQTGVWTDNPAWIFYDMLTNSRYGLGDFIQPGFVDKWTMYQIAQYCDQLVDNGQGNSGVEPRFSCNLNLQQPDDAYNVLMSLASVFRGMIYYANGTIYTTQQDNKAPVYGYTNANVIKGQFNYADSARNTRSTVANVRWNDPNNLYRQNTAYVEDTDGILRYGYVPKDMAAIGCTSPGQAYRLGQWALLAERTLTETISFQVGLEGLFIKPGDVFNVYDNFRNNANQGGRIIAFDGSRSTITLDRPVLIGSGLNYNFSAIVPKATLDGTGDVTGSNEIALIRNSQMETYAVTTSYTNVPTTTINLANGFSSGLFVGSPWILSATGGGNVFNNASIYQCLATTEVQPGIIEVVGLQYNTGLLTLVEQNYNIVPTPPNPGDFTPILPPTGLHITAVTGMFQNSVVYYYLNVAWSGTSSSNFAYYSVSGQPFGGGWENIGNVQTTGVFFNTEITGQQNFLVAAVSKGGVYSPFTSGAFIIGANNPLGMPPFSGIAITAAYDDTYINSQGQFTGYVGTTPTFTWTLPTDANGNIVGNFTYHNGFQVTLTSYDGLTTYAGPFTVGQGIFNWTVPNGLLYSMGGGNRRGFRIAVQTLDAFGVLTNGAALSVNNPYPRAPLGETFIGFNGGLLYGITPDTRDFDISGVFLWTNGNTGFVPFNTGAGNSNYSSPSIASIALDNITSGYNTWFSLADTFGVNGAPIYGPFALGPNDSISGFLIQYNAAIASFNASISGAEVQISGLQSQVTGSQAAAFAAISGSFSQLTGMITASSQIFSGDNTLQVNNVAGLSGQITGVSVINTALQVQTNAIVVSASGSLVTSINAIQANLAQSGSNLNALIGTVSTALTSTGVALANQINVLSASVYTSGTGFSLAQTTVINTAMAQSGTAYAALINAVAASLTTTGATLTANINNGAIALVNASGVLVSNINAISAALTATGVALNAQVATVSNTIVTTSGALANQVNVVQSNLATSGAQLGAQIGTVSATLVNASGSLATQTNVVSSNLTTSGASLVSQIGTVSTALATSGAALTTQINVVSAGASGYTNAQITTVTNAVASTGGALAQWIQNLSTVTSGGSASVTIAANAMVTGGSNGIGGVAISTYGFQLDANGKVVSMQAIAAQGGSIPAGFGTIVFGGADLQSSNFVDGSAGWRIKAGGDAQFSAGVFRGDFTGNGGNIQFNAGGAEFKYPNALVGKILFPVNNANNIIADWYTPGGAIGVEVGAFTIPGPSYIGQIVLNGSAGSLTVINPGTISFGSNGATAFPATMYWKQTSLILLGVGTEQAFNVDITAGGFSAKPTIGQCNCQNDAAYKARYDYGNTSTSATNAVIQVSRFDGATVGTGGKQFALSFAI